MSDPHSEIGSGPADFPAADQGRQPAHVRAAEELQSAIIRNMSPTRRLEIAQGLDETAWEIKKSGLRAQYPDWFEEQIAAKLCRIFVTGYAGA